MIEIRDKIYDLLKERSLNDAIEILANVFILLGAERLPGIDFSNEGLMKILIEEKRKHGDTLATALTEQGLYLLTWLNGEK